MFHTDCDFVMQFDNQMFICGNKWIDTFFSTSTRAGPFCIYLGRLNLCLPNCVKNISFIVNHEVKLAFATVEGVTACVETFESGV